MKNLTGKDHFDRFAKIAEKQNIKVIASAISSRCGDIKQYIVDGDSNNLNEIDLKIWDSLALYVNGRGLSLSEQVCTLKHIALYHIAECTPIFI